MKTGIFSMKALDPELTKPLTSHRYKIGDAFVSLPVPEAQERLHESADRAEQTHAKLMGILGRIRAQMQELKVTLYARFGSSINLET